MTNVIEFRRKSFGDSNADMMVCECNDMDEEYKGWIAIMRNHALGAYIDRLICVECRRSVMFESGVLMDD